MLIKDCIGDTIISVKGNTPLLDCKKLLRKHKISQLPVVDDSNSLIGILSKIDITAVIPNSGTGQDFIETMEELGHMTADQAMVKNPKTINVHDTVEHAAVLMEDFSIRCLPVLDDSEKLVGIITDWDIFRIFVNITGAKAKGYHIHFLLENKLGTLRAKLDIFREYKAQIVTILSAINEDEGTRNVTIRFKPTDPSLVKQLIEVLCADNKAIYWGVGDDLHILK